MSVTDLNSTIKIALFNEKILQKKNKFFIIIVMILLETDFFGHTFSLKLAIFIIEF